MTEGRGPDDAFRAHARVGGRRSTRGPLIATGVVAILLATAIIKPWDLPTQPVLEASPPVKALADTPSGEIARGPGEPIPSIAPRSATALVATTSHHADWGIRAVVHRVRGAVAGAPLTERWMAADVPVTGEAIPAPFDAIPLGGPLTDDADAVDALGITTPDDALPLDVRFYRPSEDRGWLRLLAAPIPGREPADWLWRPDPTWATVDGGWPSGTYRADVLLGARIVRLEVALGGRFVAAHPIDTAYPGQPVATVLDELEPGPIALTGYGPAPIAFAADGDFDERTAWLAPTLGRGFVGQVLARDVSDVGLLTKASDAPSSLWLEQVSGVPGPSRVAVEQRAVPSERGSRTATFLRPARGGLLRTPCTASVPSGPTGERRRGRSRSFPSWRRSFPCHRSMRSDAGSPGAPRETPLRSSLRAAPTPAPWSEPPATR